MTISDALGAGFGVLLDCARDVSRRVREQVDPLVDPVVRLVEGPLGLRRAPLPSLPASGTAEDPQAQVEEAKYYLGPPAARPHVDRETGVLPRAYGQDRIVLLARDPWWLFAYWEVTPTTRVEVLRELGAEAEGARQVLCVHDLAAGEAAGPVLEVEVSPGADSWYLNVAKPATSFSAAIGVRTGTGRFVPLARSNVVTTPPAQLAPDTGVRWVTLRRHGPPLEAAAWSGARVGAGRDTEVAQGSSDVHAPR